MKYFVVVGSFCFGFPRKKAATTVCFFWQMVGVLGDDQRMTFLGVVNYFDLGQYFTFFSKFSWSSFGNIFAWGSAWRRFTLGGYALVLPQGTSPRQTWTMTLSSSGRCLLFFSINPVLFDGSTLVLGKGV